MNNSHLAKLISKLGYAHESLVREGLIPCAELVHLYEDEDSLELELTPGVEIVFWADTKIFEMITFSYSRALNKDEPEFRSNLPTPLDKLKNQNDARILLGAPMFTKSKMDLMATELYGWDVYQLNPSLHPEAILDIQYNKKMNIENILISLMEKNV